MRNFFLINFIDSIYFNLFICTWESKWHSFIQIENISFRYYGYYGKTLLNSLLCPSYSPKGFAGQMLNETNYKTPQLKTKTKIKKIFVYPIKDSSAVKQS